ncbi:uncharacterized protein LOC113791538 [Dermatophagoides pteronyssinus]|uniref:uncharacterized protein LOC113791538 n=1 Tax=Dermatophagoides pteronyssinus TaxID=6956 RepID=UPI003F67DA15
MNSTAKKLRSSAKKNGEKTVSFNQKLNSLDDDRFVRNMELFDNIKLKIDQLSRLMILQRQCINSIKTFERFLKIQLNNNEMKNSEQQNIPAKLIEIKKRYEKFVKSFQSSWKRCHRFEIQERPASEIYDHLFQLFEMLNNQINCKKNIDPIESVCLSLNPIHLESVDHILPSDAIEIQDNDCSIKTTYVCLKKLRNRVTNVKKLENDQKSSLDKKKKDQNSKQQLEKNTSKKEQLKGKTKKRKNSKSTMKKSKNLEQKQIQTNKKPKSVKNRDRIFYCNFPDCDYQVGCKSSYYVHRKKHSIVRKCDICLKTFENVFSLRLHRTEHENQPLKCPYEGCDAVYSWLDTLKKHIRVHNNEATIHRCEWPGCDYQSYRIDLLRKHRTRHTGERKFICQWPDCGKPFKTESCLFDHIAMHKNERKHACTWIGCNYRCNLAGNLRKHMAIHEKKMIKTNGDINESTNNIVQQQHLKQIDPLRNQNDTISISASQQTMLINGENIY